MCIFDILWFCYTVPLEKPELIEEILSEFLNIYQSIKILQNFSF